MRLHTNQKTTFIMSEKFPACLTDTSGPASWQQVLVQILTHKLGLNSGFEIAKILCHAEAQTNKFV